MTLQIILPRLLDANGDPVNGGKANVYQTGTTTPVTTYQETGLSTPHANPIVADANGYFAQAFYSGSVAVKVVFTDAADATLYTLDPCPTSSISTSAADDITFSPTSEIPQTNVQAAIEGVQANIGALSANANTLVATAGSSSTYTLTAAETITSYAAGQRFLVRINHANTGAATLNIDSLGAKDVQKYNSSGSLVALAANDLAIGTIAEVVYDGTRFVLIDAQSHANSYVRSVTATGDVAAATVTVNGSQFDDFLDEDNMASDSATAVPSQQSVKAYVDTMGGNQSGSAPIYAARAWVNFNGTGTVAIRASGNVSSITDNGVGDYTVNFLTPMPDADFAVVGMASSAISGEVGTIGPKNGGTPTTSAIDVEVTQHSSANTDPNFVFLAVFR